MRKITKSPKFQPLIFAVLLVTISVNLPQPSSAQVKTESASFNLTAGVVVDPASSALFLMNPAGGIDAIDFSSGRRLWHSNEAAKPLRVDGDLLIAQGEDPNVSREKTGSSYFDVLVLGSHDGKRRLAAKVGLPDGVWSGVDDGLGSSLKTEAVRLDDSLVIQWQSDMQEIRGIAPNRSSSGNEALLATAQRKLAGAVRLDLQTGQVLTIQGAAEMIRQEASKSDVGEGQRIAGLPDSQYTSRNGRHVMSSEMVGDDRDFLHKYRWTIHSLATKERIGAVTSPVSRAPFFVSGSTLIYESQSYSVRLGDNRLSRERLKVRAVDLLTGGELWALPLRDTAYRGPFPP